MNLKVRNLWKVFKGSFDIFRAKIGWFFKENRSLRKAFHNLDFSLFWKKIGQKSHSYGAFKTNFNLMTNDWPLLLSSKLYFFCIMKGVNFYTFIQVRSITSRPWLIRPIKFKMKQQIFVNIIWFFTAITLWKRTWILIKDLIFLKVFCPRHILSDVFEQHFPKLSNNVIHFCKKKKKTGNI